MTNPGSDYTSTDGTQASCKKRFNNCHFVMNTGIVMLSFNPSIFVFSLPEYLIPWTNEQPTCCVQQNILEGQQCYIAKSVVEQSKILLFQTTSSTLDLPTTELPAAAKFISSSSSDSDSLSRSCGRAQEALTWVGIPSSPFISCPTSRSRFLP